MIESDQLLGASGALAQTLNPRDFELGPRLNPFFEIVRTRRRSDRIICKQHLHAEQEISIHAEQALGQHSDSLQNGLAYKH